MLVDRGSSYMTVLILDDDENEVGRLEGFYSMERNHIIDFRGTYYNENRDRFPFLFEICGD